MKIWILIFSAALFAGGTCLGVALQPKLKQPEPVVAVVPPTPMPPPDRHRHEFSVHRFASDLELTAEQDREQAVLSRGIHHLDHSPEPPRGQPGRPTYPPDGGVRGVMRGV